MINVPVIAYTERCNSIQEGDRMTAAYDAYAIMHMCLCLYPGDSNQNLLRLNPTQL